MSRELVLADRVRDALSTAVPSAEAATVLRDAQASLALIERDVARARAAALDPMASPPDAEAARALMERLQFDRDRTAAQIEKLTRRVAQLQEGEEAAGLASEYHAAAKERDELAERLRARYPALVAEMVALLEAVDVSDRRLAAVNQDLRHREWLYGAEGVARGHIEAFRQNAGQHRLRECRLVKFEVAVMAPMAWPRKEWVAP